MFMKIDWQTPALILLVGFCFFCPFLAIASKWCLFVPSVAGFIAPYLHQKIIKEVEDRQQAIVTILYVSWFDFSFGITGLLIIALPLSVGTLLEHYIISACTTPGLILCLAPIYSVLLWHIPVNQRGRFQTDFLDKWVSFRWYWNNLVAGVVAGVPRLALSPNSIGPAASEHTSQASVEGRQLADLPQVSPPSYSLLPMNNPKKPSKPSKSNPR